MSRHDIDFVAFDLAGEGTFSSREICLVDSADSSRVKVGVLFGSKLKEHRELRSTNCRCVHS
jgi:hypothetical protein